MQLSSSLFTITVGSLCIGISALYSFTVQAQEAGRSIADASQNLPDLPVANVGGSGRFSLDEESAGLGYDSRFRKWGAQLDEYSYLDPSLTLNYGMLLNSKFGAGAIATRHSDYSELLVNGVYAPMQNLRVRIASGQLRAPGNDVSGSVDEPAHILQNSYLIDLRRNSSTGRPSDFGLTAFTVSANGTGDIIGPALSSSEDVLAASDMDANIPHAGRLDGYTLNFGLQPTPSSRIELRRERTQMSYRFGDGSRDEEFRNVNQIGFAQYLSNCARFQGRYRTSADSGRLDLGLAGKRWSLDLSREFDDTAPDTAIRVGYAIPLGRSSGTPVECGARPASALKFGRLVDTTVARPSQLPREPLVQSY